MPYVSHDMVSVVQALAAEVARLRRTIEADRAGELTGEQSALVTAVYAVAGTRLFRARELRAMAALPGAPEALLRALLAGRSPKGIGKLLGAAQGKRCARSGLVLVGSGGSGTKVWSVSNVRKPTI